MRPMTLRMDVATISFGAVNVARNTFASSGPFGEDSCKSFPGCRSSRPPIQKIMKPRKMAEKLWPRPGRGMTTVPYSVTF
jgi:hypothetical protein